MTAQGRASYVYAMDDPKRRTLIIQLNRFPCVHVYVMCVCVYEYVCVMYACVIYDTCIHIQIPIYICILKEYPSQVHFLLSLSKKSKNGHADCSTFNIFPFISIYQLGLRLVLLNYIHYLATAALKTCFE